MLFATRYRRRIDSPASTGVSDACLVLFMVPRHLGDLFCSALHNAVAPRASQSQGGSRIYPACCAGAGSPAASASIDNFWRI